jgi:hypothetical protein
VPVSLEQRPTPPLRMMPAILDRREVSSSAFDAYDRLPLPALVAANSTIDELSIDQWALRRAPHPATRLPSTGTNGVH